MDLLDWRRSMCGEVERSCSAECWFEEVCIEIDSDEEAVCSGAAHGASVRDDGMVCAELSITAS